MSVENKKTKILVAGALGRMGKAAVEYLHAQGDFELCAALVRNKAGLSDEQQKYFAAKAIQVTDNLNEYLQHNKIDVLVELTTPDSVFENSKLALNYDVCPVIGATGLCEEDIAELSNLASRHTRGAIIAPNFAVGAILMMKYAAEAAKYYDKAEIIELHHDKKVDAPSGTAIKTAEMIKTHIDEVPTHSVRLPGFVAKQQVIFGGLGETLTIEHNSIDRSCFMPGIAYACRQVIKLDKLVYGLDKLM
jgi:4-hydroxy-tetrahydrodipicolinate reductase